MLFKQSEFIFSQAHASQQLRKVRAFMGVASKIFAFYVRIKGDYRGKDTGSIAQSWSTIPWFNP